MPRPSPSAFERDPLALGAGTWLACGVVLYGLTPLPLHDAALGWSPAFWLLAAPCLLLLARGAFGLRVDAQPQRTARSIHHPNVAPARRRMTPADRNRRTHAKQRAAA
ncbi:MAG TPA: hypothetical protein VFY94_04000 [Rhodanobacteraceae bacterium]|nr:hypothetical protein [Rhodanobacteraceae bacterium]